MKLCSAWAVVWCVKWETKIRAAQRRGNAYPSRIYSFFLHTRRKRGLSLRFFNRSCLPILWKNKDEITFRHEVLVWQQKWHRYSDGREQKYFCKAGCPLQALRRRVWTKRNRKIDESYFALTNSLSMYIQNNFTKKLRLQDIAKQFGYDYSYLSSFFNKNFDMDFASFVNKYRIQFACELLKDTNDDVTQIAMKCGFSTIRNFNRVFKNETGQTPKAYRKLNSSNSPSDSEQREDK